jgi:hypothetical protein
MTTITSFPIQNLVSILSFDAIQSEQLKASVNKPRTNIVRAHCNRQSSILIQFRQIRFYSIETTLQVLKEILRWQNSPAICCQVSPASLLVTAKELWWMNQE